MSSKSKSKTSSNTENNQRQTSLDASENSGVAVSSSGDASLTLLDGGAINSAFDFAREVGAAALEALETDNGAQYQQQSELLAAVASAGRSEQSQALDNMSKYLFLAVAVAGGAYLIRGAR